MWRFLAIATAIVAGAIALILALPHGPGGPPRNPHYASSRATPGPAERDPFQGGEHVVSGNAPWALSALPGCFHQLSGAAGPAAFARTRIPRGARRVPAGAALRVADCTLTVRAASALVERGENRLIVPPIARFYVAGTRLILDRSDGNHEDVRIYRLAGGVPPQFVTAPHVAAARKP